MAHDLSAAPHRRYNPLMGEWVLVSPHRNQRPWLGQVERAAKEQLPAYEPGCYLCPGNTRAGGHRNPVYKTTYVFDNDFPALLPDEPGDSKDDAPIANSHRDGLFEAKPVLGTCRVVCFSPRHDLTLAGMEIADIHEVVNIWAEQVEELGSLYRWVQVFENKGAVMGCSNPHPHGQIWALDTLPVEAQKEDRHQIAYCKERGQPLLLDYARLEGEIGERVIVENDEWLAVVPYWAVWPYEALLLPRRHILHLPDLAEIEREALAEIMKSLLVRYDLLFDTSFPYSMGWHGAPTGLHADTVENSHWQLHAHYYPPLLRSATVKKFMVGFEMLGEPQRDLTPEVAASRLKNMPGTFPG